MSLCMVLMPVHKIEECLHFLSAPELGEVTLKTCNRYPVDHLLRKLILHYLVDVKPALESRYCHLIEMSDSDPLKRWKALLGVESLKFCYHIDRYTSHSSVI